MTREGIGNSKMAEDRAVRLSYIALFFHNIGAAVVLALWVAVVILHRPGWLIWVDARPSGPETSFCPLM